MLVRNSGQPQTNANTYTLTNQPDKPRVVFVQHPIQQGWKLAGDVPKPESRTANSYRFRVNLKARETVALPISERRELMETYDLERNCRKSWKTPFGT
jgi:hypothetical protein